jgi:hypothetical protein
MFRSLLLVASLVAPLAARSPAVAAPSVDLTVVEDAGVAREHASVRGTIPCARGALGGAAGRMRGPAGPVPADFRVLSRWPDGSVRWLETRFVTSIAAGARESWTFEGAEPAPAAATALRVDEHDDRVDVTTGPLSFSVRKDRFDPLANLAYETTKPLAGPVVALVRLGAGGGEAERPERVSVTERGAYSAAIALTGRHRGGFLYRIELRVYAGEPVVDVTTTFVNATDPLASDVREIGFRFPLTMAPVRRYTVGVAGGRPLVGRLDAEGFTLRQEDASRFGGTHAGGKAAGWLDLSARRWGVVLAARDFWEEYPKALRATPTLLAYDVWPADFGPPAHIGTGVAKTQAFRLVFHPGTLGTPAIAALAGAALAPLVALPTPAAAAASGAVPNLPPPGAATQRLLDAFATSFQRYVKIAAQEHWNDSGTVDCSGPARERIGYFGMLNWGDWNFPKYMDRSDDGCETWGNLEYDLPQVLGLALLASGDRAYRHVFEAAARHYRDVDVVHYAKAHPELVGMNHPHKPLHFDLTEPPKIDLGHTWAEGLFMHHVLSGEDASLAGGRGIADYLARAAATHSSANPRQWGWPAIALIAAQRATGEQRYLTAAQEYARRGTREWPPSLSGADWKLGVLADGVSEVHAESDDPDLERWLLAYADALAADPSRRVDLRYYPALAYAYHLTGRDTYRDAATAALTQMRLGNWGKPLAANGRAAFRMVALLASPPRATPPGESSPTPVATPTPATMPTPAASLRPAASPAHARSSRQRRRD